MPTRDWLELSDTQRSILVHEAIAGWPIYNMPMCFRLNGHIDPKALTEALHAVLLGHSALSSNYEPNRARRADEAEVRDVEFTHEMMNGGESAGVAALTTLWERPFDLRTELPVRFRLISLSLEEHLFGVCMHHVAGDDWSIAIFLRDLSSAYSSYLATGEASVKGADFFTHAAREAALERNNTWWVERLKGARIAHPPQPLADLGESQLLDLGIEAHTRQVRAVALRAGISAVSVLLTAVALAARDESGVAESLIGIPYAMRDTEELRRIVGPLLRTLPVRTLWNDQAEPVDILRAHSASLLASISNSAVPYSRILSAARTAGLPAGTPLFTHLLNVDAGQPRLHLSGARCHVLEVQPRWSTFPVVWDFIIPTVGNIKGLLRVSSVLYSPMKAMDWVQMFQAALEAFGKSV